MTEPEFFDVGCQAGINEKGCGETIDVLLSEMDRFGVSKALVSDYALNKLGAKLSNQRISDMLKTKRERELFGVWCILPEQCDELPRPENLFGEMKKNKIAALTLRPIEHRWVPCGITIGNYMREAQRHQIPVMLDDFSGQWNMLYDFVQEFPENTYIFPYYFGKWGIDRQIRPLLEHYPNFYFGIGGYWQPDGISQLVGKYGAQRLLFSSAFPAYTHGAAMLQLKQSGMAPEIISAIASGNIMKLLEGER